MGWGGSGDHFMLSGNQKFLLSRQMAPASKTYFQTLMNHL